jgi:uncharacterized protein YcbK (DUF882 family)
MASLRTEPAPHTGGNATKKDVSGTYAALPRLLGTLVQLRTGECVPLDEETPTQGRFDLLLADRVTGEAVPIDPHLLALLRRLSARHGLAGAPRIEIVSGYRSPKLNEVLRKKGRRVASHSQHSRGQAVDFRLVPAGASRGLDPRPLEQELRALGWDGGIGVYPTNADWFVHADVGPRRRWTGT